MGPALRTMLLCVIKIFSGSVRCTGEWARMCPKVGNDCQSVSKLHAANGDFYFFIQRVSIEHQPY